MKERRTFLEYLNNKADTSFEVFKNHKNKRLIFIKEIGTEKYYIKKYILKGRKALPVILGLKRDRAEHYKFISEKLKEYEIKHVEPYYIKVQKKSFFYVNSILVTVASGNKSLEDYMKDFKNYRDWFSYFFDTFILLCKNRIYSTDYNLSGMLVNEKKELLLIDFDSYKIKFYLTENFKRYIIEGLKKGYGENNFDNSKEFKDYWKKEVERVVEELNWGIQVGGV